jgi:hypothetical protein
MNEIIEIGTNEGGANPAYIRELYLIRKSDIIKMQNHSYYANIGNYEFKPEMIEIQPSAEVFKLNFVWRNCEWVETIKSNLPLSYFNSIDFEISMIEPEVRKWALDNMQQEFIVIFFNRANQIFIIGNIDVGLELSVISKLSPKNGIGISLNAELGLPAFEISQISNQGFFSNYEFLQEFYLGEELIEIGNNKGGANPAHIRELFLIRKNDVLQMQNHLYYANIESQEFSPEMIQLKASAQIFKLNFVWRTCQWVETIKSNIPVSFYNSIDFEISRIEAEARKWALDNMQQEFIVIFSNRANQTFIVGSIDVGLELSVISKISPKNGISISLDAELAFPAFEISQMSIQEFFTNYEFSEEFYLGQEFN